LSLQNLVSFQRLLDLQHHLVVREASVDSKDNNDKGGDDRPQQGSKSGEGDISIRIVQLNSLVEEGGAVSHTRVVVEDGVSKSIVSSLEFRMELRYVQRDTERDTNKKRGRGQETKKRRGQSVTVTWN
jgi:hypothetical protein